MAFQRHFLGLEKPALDTAAEYIGRRFATRSELDLTDVLIVTPGARAGRRLNERLCHWANEHQVRYLPPEIATESRVPELLYSPRLPYASEWIQQLTWADAIRTIDAEHRIWVFPNAPNELVADLSNSSDDPEWTASEWLELGKVLMRTYRELAGEGLLFSDVAKKAKSLAGIPESELKRWDSLSKIQRRYLDLLRQRKLWDRQSARQYAIDHHECKTSRKIVLVATADLTKTLRLMLNQALDDAEATGSAEPSQLITALVHAPQAWEERFDDDGCILSGSWKAAEISIENRQIEFATDFVDQARCVIERLAQENGKYTSEEITLGCADERVIGPTQRALASQGLHGRWGIGRSVTESGPYLLLDALREFVAADHAESVAKLLRHPDIESWLYESGLRGDWIRQLDGYREEFVPGSLPGKQGKWLGPPGKYRTLQAAWAKLIALKKPFTAQPKPLSDWAPSIIEVFSNVYGHRTWDINNPAERILAGAADLFRDLFKEQLTLPPDITRPLSGHEAIELALEYVQSGRIPEPADADAIEMLGWLELPLDDAGLLIVTGMNEGIIPRSTTGDPFLPNLLRQHLKIEDNDHRYAREAYALATIAESSRAFHLIVGRRNVDGDPLLPSRLLFTGSDEAIASKWREILGINEYKDGILETNEPMDAPKEEEVDDAAKPRTFGFTYGYPRRFVNQPLSPMSITSFATYLECPYRYYLKRVLKIDGTTDDDLPELRPMTLGNHIHAVLEAFGNSQAKDSIDADEIHAALLNELQRIIASDLADPMLPTVEIQLQQMERRLGVFAEEQAKWAGQGWRIIATEHSCNDVVLRTGGNAVRLSGTIDRVDYREETGEYAILDYKTGQNAKQLKDVLTKKGEWIDLQLPLYRYIGNQKNWLDAKVGYINLPSRFEDTRFVIADWSDAHFESAQREAERIVDSVAEQIFWPPGTPRYDNEGFGLLLMRGVPERPDEC